MLKEELFLVKVVGFGIALIAVIGIIGAIVGA